MAINVFNDKIDELLNFESFKELENEIDKLTSLIGEIEKRKATAGNIEERLTKVAEELQKNTALLITGEMKANDLKIYELSKEYAELTNLQKELDTLQALKENLDILKQAKALWEEKIKKENKLKEDLQKAEEELTAAQKELSSLANKIINKNFDLPDLNRIEELQKKVIPELERKYQELKEKNDKSIIDGPLPNDIKEQAKQHMSDVYGIKKNDEVEDNLVTNGMEDALETESLEREPVLDGQEEPLLNGNPKVMVRFDLHGGKNLNQKYNPIKLNRGVILKKIESPILDDEHEFECWMVDGKPFDLNTPINEDIVLEAKYKMIKNSEEKVNVKFKLNNGTNPNEKYENISLIKGTSLKRPEDPILTDEEGNVYDFEYWMVDGKRFWFNTLIEHDIVLEAKFKETPKKYVEINFDLSGGGHDEYNFDTTTLSDGEMLVRPEVDPVLDDEHVFDCWMLGDEPYDFTRPVKKDLVLKAKYKSKYDKNTITFKNKKGKVIKTVEVLTGDSISAEDMPKPKHKMLKLSSWKVGEENFDTNTIIKEDIEVVASYQKDWKRIAAVGAGVAAGAMAKVLDATLFNTPGVFSTVSVGVNIVASIISTKKLKNHKDIDAKVGSLKGIKKANAKLVNYFRDEKNIKDLRAFFITATVTSAISAATEFAFANDYAQEAETAFNDMFGNSAEEIKVADYFENNDPEYIFDTASDALNNIEPEAGPDLFEGAVPARAYNPECDLWMTISEDTSIEDVKRVLGTDNPLFDFQKNGTSIGWVDLQNSYNIGGLGR